MSKPTQTPDLTNDYFKNTLRFVCSQCGTANCINVKTASGLQHCTKCKAAIYIPPALKAAAEAGKDGKAKKENGDDE